MPHRRHCLKPLARLMRPMLAADTSRKGKQHRQMYGSGRCRFGSSVIGILPHSEGLR